MYVDMLRKFVKSKAFLSLPSACRRAKLLRTKIGGRFCRPSKLKLCSGVFLSFLEWIFWRIFWRIFLMNFLMNFCDEFFEDFFWRIFWRILLMNFFDCAGCSQMVFFSSLKSKTIDFRKSAFDKNIFYISELLLHMPSHFWRNTTLMVWIWTGNIPNVGKLTAKQGLLLTKRLLLIGYKNSQRH